MATLFVDKTVAIHASPSVVWNILTNPKYTDLWAIAFTNGAPFHIYSTWQLGDPVLWKDHENKTIVEGIVTRIEPYKCLRFSVSDTQSKKITPKSEDGITYELTKNHENTRLHVRQGDFAIMPDGEKYFIATERIWDKALSKIKELAEALIT